MVSWTILPRRRLSQRRSAKQTTLVQVCLSTNLFLPQSTGNAAENSWFFMSSKIGEFWPRILGSTQCVPSSRRGSKILGAPCTQDLPSALRQLLWDTWWLPAPPANAVASPSCLDHGPVDWAFSCCRLAQWALADNWKVAAEAANKVGSLSWLCMAMYVTITPSPMQAVKPYVW